MNKQLFILSVLGVVAILAGCSQNVQPFSIYGGEQLIAKHAECQTIADLKRENFQKVIDGKNVDLYTIKNKNGMIVKITNYGAKIEQILVYDRHKRLGDVVLGYETIDGVLSGQGSMGAFRWEGMPTVSEAEHLPLMVSNINWP